MTVLRPTLSVCIVNPFGYELFERDGAPSKIFGGAEVQLYRLATALARDPVFAVSMIVEERRRCRLEREGVRMIGVRPMSAGFARLRDPPADPAPGLSRRHETR